MVMPERVEFPTYETLLTEAIRSLAVDSGTVTTPASVGTNVLHDTTKNWAANVHKNRLVKIIRGAGTGQLAVIDSNTAKSLVIKESWAIALGTTSVYVILDKDLAQILRDVLNTGYDISVAHPLETHDPTIEDVEGKLNHPDYGLAALKALIDSLAGGAFYGSYGPKNVEVDTDVDFGTIIYDPAGNIITTAEITPGTYTIHRVRAGVDSEVVGSTASSEAAGRVFITYTFPNADWNVGDIFYITFSGIIVTADGIITEYPNLFIWGRVVREADISSKVDDIETKLDHAGHGLAALAGMLADILEDTGTDLEAKLDALYPYHGLVYYGTVTGIDNAPRFQCSGLVGFGNDFFEDYWAYVVWDDAGGGAAPQGEMLQCTGYVSADGDFTVAAYTPVIAIGDIVLLLHPAIASLINTTYGLSALKDLIAALEAKVEEVYKEQIPDVDFSIAPDATLTTDPPSADAENSVVDIDQVASQTFVLRSLWVNVTSLGTDPNGGAKMTFKLWVPVNGTVTEVDSVDVTATGIQNLMDLFGLPEVHADGIWITAQTAAGTGAVEGTYNWAKAIT